MTNSQLRALIRAIHTEREGAYGSPRTVRELRARGLPASKERVERLMREHGIHARHQRRYRITTDSRYGLPVAANLPGYRSPIQFMEHWISQQNQEKRVA